MPHWLQAAVAVATAAAGWRWVWRPVRAFGRESLALLRQIRESSRAQAQLSRDLGELAGAFIRYAVSNQARLDEHDQALDEHDQALDDIRELLVDLDADVRRLERAHRETPHPPEGT